MLRELRVKGIQSLREEREVMFEKTTDKDLATKVTGELQRQIHIDSTHIDVSVTNGVATLTGAVPTYLQKLHAQEAAHRVIGILDVANDIEVKAVDRFARTDTQIASAVRNALEWDALVPNELIQSTVSNGWVILDGEVDYWREREDAERAIRRLLGVVGVTNRITIRERTVESEQLREAVESALERRADREAKRLRVEIDNGKVEVFGRVHSWQEKRAVVGSLSHQPGVLEVRDHLRIDPYF
jgi:osmotically-inducible protein OsmY